MSTQIEKDLRDALSDQAAKLPRDVSDGVLAHDFHPRGSAGRTALAVGTLTLAAAIVLAVSVVGLGSDPPRAFAGWSATPTAARGGQVNTALSQCRAQLAGTAHLLLSRETAPRAHHPLSAPAVPTNAWQTVLIDTRGPYTLILFEADHGRATSVCFSGTRKNQGALGSGIGLRPPAPVPPGRAIYSGSGSRALPRDEGSHQFSWVVGRTGAGVEGVTIRLNNGTRVAASRATGWFLAWWPGSHGIRATEVTTAAGTEDQ